VTKGLPQDPSPKNEGGPVEPAPRDDAPPPFDAGDVDPETWLNCWSMIDGCARLLVTGDRNLLGCDRGARIELSSCESLRQSGARIEPADPGTLDDFVEFLDVPEGGINILCLPRRRKEGHLLMRASRLAVDAGIPVIAIACRGTGPEFKPLWADIAEIFDLTPAEHRMVQALLSAISPEAIAKKQRLSINTVRTHIRNVYIKLDISSVDELRRSLAGFRIN
jgi:DNA-binding CsgD family transcriptional regulator